MTLKDLGIDEKDPRPVIVIVGNAQEDADIAAAVIKVATGDFDDYQVVFINDQHELEEINPAFANVGSGRHISVGQIGLRKAIELAKDMPAIEIHEPVSRTKTSFDEPFMIKAVDRSYMYEYRDIPKKGKNSWKPDYKYHQ